MEATAVVLERPERLALQRLAVSEPGEADIVVDVAFSGISTGTEKLLWSGRMPDFPGMGYPLVPGYESIGRIVHAGPCSGLAEGQTVFVPGARCYGEVRGLFGGASSRLVVPGARAIEIDAGWGESGILLSLAATAHHAIATGESPDLIVGHGVLGRLIARIAVALGHAPAVWEVDPLRRDGAAGYAIMAPEEDARADYPVICDASGAAGLLDMLIPRLAKGGEIVLAGFYEAPLSFAFPPAFMKEARIRIAAEFRETDLVAVRGLIAEGRLSLDGLITHRSDAAQAGEAYRTAFGDSACLKMILDWRTLQ